MNAHALQAKVETLQDGGKYHEAAKAVLEGCGATLAIKPGSGKAPRWGGTGMKHYRCTIKTQGGRYGFDFWQSIHDTKLSKAPTEYDVLVCMQWRTHEDNPVDFAASYGYRDGKEAMRIWKACKRQSDALGRLFTDEQLDALSVIA